jgi:pimeloyl-ACP methyl ester carboxylesterase
MMNLHKALTLPVAAVVLALAAAAHAQVNTVASKDGTQIAFERTGSGPVLILVNGALSDRTSGRRLATALAPKFTVIGYDRRGRGESGDTPPYAPEREVEDLEAVIDHAGGKAFLFGTSSGAALALETSIRFPDKVAKQVLFEPPFVVDASRPPIPEELQDQVSKRVAEGRRGDAVEYFMTKAVGVPAEAVLRMREQPIWPQMEKLAHTIAYDAAVVSRTPKNKQERETRWAAVTVPTLVIDGEMSDMFLRNSVEALARTIPAAQRRTLAGQDHSAPFADPHSLVEPLVEFLLGSP